MNGHKMDSVTAENYLGIWISHDMKASILQQCIQEYSTANKLLGVLNRTIKCKDVGNLLCFYKSLIRPHLEFCTAAWSPHYMKYKVLIEKVQRRFRKMIPHLKNIPFQERLAPLKLWSLDDRRVRADLIEVFKITYGYSSIIFDTFFEVDSAGRTRGHRWKLKKKRINIDPNKLQRSYQPVTGVAHPVSILVRMYGIPNCLINWIGLRLSNCQPTESTSQSNHFIQGSWVGPV